MKKQVSDIRNKIYLNIFPKKIFLKGFQIEKEKNQNFNKKRCGCKKKFRDENEDDEVHDKNEGNDEVHENERQKRLIKITS